MAILGFFQREVRRISQDYFLGAEEPTGSCAPLPGLTVWQKTTSRRYCRLRYVAMVGALSCISRNTIAFLALSLIMATQSVRVVSRG